MNTISERPSQPQPSETFFRAPTRKISGPNEIIDENEFRQIVLNQISDIKDYLYNGFMLYKYNMEESKSEGSAPSGYKEGEYQQGGRKKTRSQKNKRSQKKTRRHR